MCCIMNHLLILDTPKVKVDMETSIKGTKFMPDAQRGRKIAIGKGPEKERKRQTVRQTCTFSPRVVRGQIGENLIEKSKIHDI